MAAFKVLAYMIGLALGYWVLTHAEREKATLKTIGRVIGWVIIVVSFIGPLCLACSKIYCHLHGDVCSYSAQCPWSGHVIGRDGQCMGMMGSKDTKTDEEKSK